MGNSIILPVRSGVTNSLTWIFIELLVGYVIDRLLIILHNRLCAQSLRGGAQLEIRESCVPFFGSGVLYRHEKGWMMITIRLMIVIGFFTMNLGIDGADSQQYKTEYFHSRLGSGFGCDKNRVSHIGWAITKCTRYSADLGNFNLTAPVFNITRETGRGGFIEKRTLFCLDGFESKELEILVTGERLLSKVLRDRYNLNGWFLLYALNDNDGRVWPLGGRVLPRNTIYELRALRQARKGGISLLTSGRLVSFCHTRSQLPILDDDGIPIVPKRMGQGFFCVFAYDNGNRTVLFTGRSERLYQRSNGVVTKLHLSSALVFASSGGGGALNFTRADIRDLASPALDEENEEFGFLTGVLTCRFDATTNRSDVRRKLIRSTEYPVTKVRHFSVIIAIMCVVFAIFLTLAVCCGLWKGDAGGAGAGAGMPDNLQLNTIDGVSRLLAMYASGRRSVTSDTRARVTYDGVLWVSSSDDVWAFDHLHNMARSNYAEYDY